MLIIETSLEKASAAGGPLPAPRVRRTAFFLQSQGQWLFAWLHVSRKPPCHRHGVVLCPPLGHEQIHSQRSWGRLADVIAEAGLPVLRFDYHGTADSAGSDEDANRHAVWLANIRDALVWLPRNLGCTQISLVGMRLGASLAMEAAAQQEVDNLLLWAPVVKGRAYVREMKALGLTATARSQIAPGAPDDIEAAGFIITKQTADDLNQIDLLTVRPRCRRILIMARDDVPEDRRLLEHLLAQGIQTEQSAQPGYPDMMVEPHYAKVPAATIAYAASWLSARTLADETGIEDVNIDMSTRAEGLIVHQSSRQAGEASPQPIRESALHLSEQPNLFGVLSQPVDGADEQLPLILMVNAGSAYRVGPNRLYVILARHLACQGFRCVRMDLAGLGDSVTTTSHCENDPYATTGFRDIEIALKSLEARLGARRVVLMGLCSGAYFAFQSAAQLANPALLESVLINPLTFFWKEGMSLETSPTKHHAAFHYYWKAAFKPDKWLKFLSGRSTIGIFGALKMCARRWHLGKRPAESTPVESSAKASGEAVLAHPLREDLAGDLERIAKADRQLACFFATSDPGYSILTFHAKRKVRELLGAGKMSISFIDDADHTFTCRAPRQALVRALGEYLRKRFQSRTENMTR